MLVQHIRPGRRVIQDVALHSIPNAWALAKPDDLAHQLETRRCCIAPLPGDRL